MAGLSGLAQLAVRASGLDTLVARVSAVFTGPQGQFSPGEPIPPILPDEEPKRQQFGVGTNLVYQPRRELPTSFEQLRYFAANYEVAAICIATRIEELAGMDYKFVPKDKKARKDKKFQKDIDRVTAFWERPDRQNDWPSWLRMLLQDRLEIDAVTLFPRPNRGGGLYSVEILDGSTMKVLVDARGRIPDPPAPAYQQVLWGVPRSMWSADKVLYLPQNVRTYTVYGRSEIELILYVVNLAMRKRLQDLSHFTDSNIPRALIGAPADWTPDQIEKFQTFWDAYLSGDPVKRSRMIMAPGSGTAGGRLAIHEFSPFSGDTEFDTWLLKLTCAALQVTPTEIGFTEDTNKSSAQTQERVQVRGGTNPLSRYVSGIVNRINRDYLEAGHLVHEWDTSEEEDDLTLAQVDNIYGMLGVIQPDEMREKLGLEPYGIKPFILVNQRPILVEDLEAYAKMNVQEEALIAQAGPGAPGGAVSSADASGGPPPDDGPRDASLPSTSPSMYADSDTQKSLAKGKNAPDAKDHLVNRAMADPTTSALVKSTVGDEAGLRTHMDHVFDHWENGANSRVTSLQHSANEEFGLGRDEHLKAFGKDGEMYGRGDRTALPADYHAKFGPLNRRILRHMHDLTQEHLKEKGITHVPLYRGVQIPDEDLPATFPGGKAGWRDGHPVDVHHPLPLASWTTDKGTAQSFGRGPNAWVVSANVPAEHVLSYHGKHGFGGVTGESESVVLGHQAPAHLFSTKSWSDDKQTWIRKDGEVLYIRPTWENHVSWLHHLQRQRAGHAHPQYVEPSEPEAEKVVQSDENNRDRTTQEARDDLRRWRSKVLKAVKAGKPMPTFTSTAIPEPLMDVIAQDLLDLTKVAAPDREDAVRQTFSVAQQVLDDSEDMSKSDDTVVLGDEFEVAEATGFEDWDSAWADPA